MLFVTSKVDACFGTKRPSSWCYQDPAVLREEGTSDKLLSAGIVTETDITAAPVLALDSMEHQGHVRSSSSGSSSSFDSCSDLLESLDLQLKGSPHLASLEQRQQQETKSCTVEETVPSKSESLGLDREKLLQEVLDKRGPVLTTLTVKQAGQSVENKLAKVESGDFVIEDGTDAQDIGKTEIKSAGCIEGTSMPLDVSSFKVQADQSFEECGSLQSGQPLEPGSSSPLNSVVTVGKAHELLCLLDSGKPAVHPEMVRLELRKGVSHIHAPCALLDNGGEHAAKEMESVQQRVDNDSEVLTAQGDLKRGHISDRDLDDCHIQSFVDHRRDEVEVNVGEMCQATDGVDIVSNHLVGDLKPATERTGIYAHGVSFGEDASQLFVKEEWGGSLVASGKLDISGTKSEASATLDNSDDLLFGGAGSQIQDQSDFDSIFAEGTDDEGQSLGSYPGSRSNIEVEHQHLSSSEIIFGNSDWDEFMHESIGEKACVMDQFNSGYGTGVVRGLVEGPSHATEDYLGASNTKERMFAYTESDDDLQQLEDSIKFFNLQKSNSVVPHFPRSLSSGCGRPDLEEADEQVDLNELAGGDEHDGSAPWNSSREHMMNFSNNVTESLLVRKNGLYEDGHIHFGGKKLSSAGSERELESEGVREDLEGLAEKGEESQTHAVERKIDVVECPLIGPEEVPHCANSGAYSSGHHVGDERVMQFHDIKVSEAMQSHSHRHEKMSKIALEELIERDQAVPLAGKEAKQPPQAEEDKLGKALVLPVKQTWKEASLQVKSRTTLGWGEEELGPDELSRYVEALDVNESYIDTVLDMEDVLLNSDESSGGRFLHATNSSTIAMPRPARDGSLSSSTSGVHLLSSNYSSLAESIPFTLDWVEVVGARQRKGGSSLGERMVGVKDHTVYCLKVTSGTREWEVLRRYRDFVDLYHQLKRMFNAQTNLSLPSPWEEVECESRKVFGNTSPNVIEVRTFRIERCLQSLLQAGFPFNTASPLFWFLRPKGIFGGSYFEDQENLFKPASPVQKGLDIQLGALDSPQLQSPRSDAEIVRAEQEQDRSPFIFGKTIKLVVKIHSYKSLKQLLYAQHHSCAGCYKRLDVEKGLMQGFVQTLGWGKPRLCHYSGQLFCASCHLNETAVLPAQVLRHWDFTPRRVSQLAKAYLDSIYDQPMLCVSAVNPYLYSRVPILAYITETRRRLSRMLSCVHCPSRARIQQTMGSRRYLLENNDFFALRDLEDLSKGAFAVLPGLLKAVSENLIVHITKQCSVCQDTGEWCGAGILCEDPFSPIFPFQDDDVISCKVCHVPFHKTCFRKCSSCPSCRKGWSGQAAHALESLDASSHDNVHQDSITSSDAQSITRNVSPSSNVGQGSCTELEEESHSPKSWSFYKFVQSRRRLW